MFKKPAFWFSLLTLLVIVTMVVQLRQQSRLINPILTSTTDTAIQPKSPDKVTIFPADPVRGVRSGASVTIVQFSDFECPYCAQMAPLLKQFVEQNQDRVSLVWKDFPLPDHINALSAAQAAQCAALQNKFWEYHDELYANQSSLGDTLYEKVANNLNLDMPKFITCRGQGQALPLIQRNMQEGQAVGVDGTPYYIINGRVHSGILTQTELNDLLLGY